MHVRSTWSVPGYTQDNYTGNRLTDPSRGMFHDVGKEIRGASRISTVPAGIFLAATNCRPNNGSQRTCQQHVELRFLCGRTRKGILVKIP